MGDDDDDEDDGFDAPPAIQAALVPPGRLAEEINVLVRNLRRQFGPAAQQSADAEEDMWKTIEKIRQIAKQARLVIGEVYGEGDMDRFGAALRPAFEELTMYRQRTMEK